MIAGFAFKTSHNLHTAKQITLYSYHEKAITICSQIHSPWGEPAQRSRRSYATGARCYAPPVAYTRRLYNPQRLASASFSRRRRECMPQCMIA